jgi:hypothetical protein
MNQIISNTEIVMAFGKHDEQTYGAKALRGLIEQACLFAACGKPAEWALRHVCIELGLFAEGCNGLTKLGKDFLMVAFYTTEIDPIRYNTGE